MSFGWHPEIDNWIPNTQWLPESYSGNTETTREPHMNVPPAHLTDMVGTQSYAPGEGEEMKIRVTGFGDLTVKEIKEKLVEVLDDLASAAKSDDLPDVEKIEHNLYGTPELQNLVKEYCKHIKMLKSRESH